MQNLKLDKELQENLDYTFSIYDSFDTELTYFLNFSGGKDSHAVLGSFIQYCQTVRKLKGEIVFSDTYLEDPKLYSLIDKAKTYVESKGLTFKKVLPLNSYWYYQFVIGYPVPNWKNRWCTGRLKIDNLERNKENQEGFTLTGRHLGESATRDAKLTTKNSETNKTCGSASCGEDVLSSKDDTIEPILIWRDCNVWDYIYTIDSKFLYTGVYNSLNDVYAIHEDSTGSLRMGCFMCPVVGKGTLKNKVENDPTELNKLAYDIRLLIEELRLCQRLNNPKTKLGGAILFAERKKIWKKLSKYFPWLLKYKLITQNEIELINQVFQKNQKTYPKTYTNSYVLSEERRLAKEKIQSFKSCHTNLETVSKN